MLKVFDIYVSSVTPHSSLILLNWYLPLFSFRITGYSWSSKWLGDLRAETWQSLSDIHTSHLCRYIHNILIHFHFLYTIKGFCIHSSSHLWTHLNLYEHRPFSPSKLPYVITDFPRYTSTTDSSSPLDLFMSPTTPGPSIFQPTLHRRRECVRDRGGCHPSSSSTHPLLLDGLSLHQSSWATSANRRAWLAGQASSYNGEWATFLSSPYHLHPSLCFTPFKSILSLS